MTVSNRNYRRWDWLAARGCARLVLLAALSLLGACAELEALNRSAQLSGQGADQSPQGQVAEVLAYVRYVDGLHTLDSQLNTALQGEYQTLDRVVREYRRPVNRIKLAWLLALPGTRFQDSNRSLELLREVGAELGPGPSEIHDMVAWMRRMIDYQSQLALKLKRVRSWLRVAKSEGSKMEQQNLLLKEQSTELRQKINALTHIETGIDDASYP
jgi:hypothetical protein